MEKRELTEEHDDEEIFSSVWGFYNYEYDFCFPIREQEIG